MSLTLQGLRGLEPALVLVIPGSAQESGLACSAPLYNRCARGQKGSAGLLLGAGDADNTGHLLRCWDLM